MRTIFYLLLAVTLARERRTSHKSFVDDCSDEDFEREKPKYKIYKAKKRSKSRRGKRDEERCYYGDSSDSDDNCGCHEKEQYCKDDYKYYNKEYKKCKEPECKYCKEPECKYCKEPECKYCVGPIVKYCEPPKYKYPKCQTCEQPSCRYCEPPKKTVCEFPVKTYHQPQRKYSQQPQCQCCEKPKYPCYEQPRCKYSCQPNCQCCEQPECPYPTATSQECKWGPWTPPPDGKFGHYPTPPCECQYCEKPRQEYCEQPKYEPEYCGPPQYAPQPCQQPKQQCYQPCAEPCQQYNKPCYEQPYYNQQPNSGYQSSISHSPNNYSQNQGCEPDRYYGPLIGGNQNSGNDFQNLFTQQKSYSPAAPQKKGEYGGYGDLIKSLSSW